MEGYKNITKMNVGEARIGGDKAQVIKVVKKSKEKSIYPIVSNFPNKKNPPNKNGIEVIKKTPLIWLAYIAIALIFVILFICVLVVSLCVP
jgi:hypothetical protein